MPAIKCGGCAKYLSPAEGVKCTVCYAAYHRTCVGLSKGMPMPSWRCPECTKHDRRDNKAETPVRGRIDLGHTSDCLVSPGATCRSASEAVTCLASDVSTEHEQVSPVTARHVSSEVTSPSADVVAELRLFKDEIRDEFRLMREEVVKLRAEVSELRNSIRTCGERMDSLDARVDALELKLVQSTLDKSSMEGVVEELRCQLNERDQEVLRNDVEVSGIPESKEESTLHLVKVLSTKLGVVIDETDIVHAERAGSSRRNRVEPSGDSADAPVQRPRNLIVRFTRRVPRDILLRESRVRRGVNAGELGFGDPSRSFRIHVNERLTRFNRSIFYKARQAGGMHNWKYVWTKGGKIFARKEDGQKVQRITCEDDITRIFGKHTVGPA